MTLISVKPDTFDTIENLRHILKFNTHDAVIQFLLASTKQYEKKINKKESS